jgi:hypothetical protein
MKAPQEWCFMRYLCARERGIFVRVPPFLASLAVAVACGTKRRLHGKTPNRLSDYFEDNLARRRHSTSDCQARS